MTAKLPSDETADDAPVILAIDDEERVVQAFDLWLDDSYQIRKATSGPEGLDKLDETVDLVILDRHMPGMSGQTVLEEIRAESYDCMVVMLTAVDPDTDIVTMDFDDYITKPAEPATLRAVIPRLVQLTQYDTRIADLYTIERKIALLEAKKTQHQLDESEAYETLREHRRQARTAVNDLVSEHDREELDQLLEFATTRK